MASNGIPSWSTTAANNVTANTGVNWDEGQAPSTVNDSARQILADLALWYANEGPSLLENFSFTCSVGASALTIALKRRDGSDPTTVNPARFAFRNVTAATGDYSLLNVSAATSLVVSSGSTLGTVNATLAQLWIVGFNDGGTFRLGIYNPLSASSYVAPREDLFNSSTAEGGAGAADSAQTYYTGVAVSSKAMRILAYIECTEATAGTWATAPSKVQLFGVGTPQPRSQPTRQTFTSGSGTYTTPAGATRIFVRIVGGGGGGAAVATNSGTSGGNTTFSTLTANGGGPGVTAGGNGGAGGTASGGSINIAGSNGQGGGANATATTFLSGGNGGSSALGGAGGGGNGNNGGTAAATNSGSGGGGAGGVGTGNSGGGGGSGGYVELSINSPAATYSYGVGAKGTGGSAGSIAGSDGAAGIVIVDEFYV